MVNELSKAIQRDSVALTAQKMQSEIFERLIGTVVNADMKNN
jgi:hypothetical protein